MLQHATSVIGPPGTAMPSPGRDLVAELRREVKSLEERNRELHRELIEAKRASIRVVELEGKVAQLEDELADKDGEMEVEIQNVIEEIDTEHQGQIHMIDRVIYEVIDFTEPSVMAEQLYHTLTAENGTHTSWGAAPARTRRAFTHVCEILFRDVRRAIHDYNRGIIRTPEQVGS